MDEMISMDVEGMDELMDSFKSFIKKYPDRAGDLLVGQARALRKDVVKMVKSETKTDGSSKRSIAKLKEYKISKVQGIGEKQFVEISGKAPHFHLVENGHKLTDSDGKPVGQGYVTGYHFMDRASKKRQIEIPKDLEATIDKILKEEGLT